MPKPRKEQVCLEATSYYHCVSRCVRKAYLCGVGINTNESYEHRRGWLENELIKQVQVFSIDIAAYAIMSNHYHVVLHINKSEADNWSFDEVIDRWHKLYKGNVLSQRFRSGVALSETEIDKLYEYAELWRERLIDISWFMRRLNEFISRQANYEDNCTGRFWEGRFKSQALLDEKALAACLAYVDLNPVRACMANAPETSEFTSIKQRAEKAKTAYSANQPNQQVKYLMPLAGNPKQEMPFGLPFKLTDYLELIELTRHVIRDDKRGSISNTLPPILQRLNIDSDSWLKLTTSFESSFKDLVGNPTALSKAVELLDRKRRPSVKNCQTLLA